MHCRYLLTLESYYIQHTCQSNLSNTVTCIAS